MIHAAKVSPVTVIQPPPELERLPLVANLRGIVGGYLAGNHAASR